MYLMYLDRVIKLAVCIICMSICRMEGRWWEEEPEAEDKH